MLHITTNYALQTLCGEQHNVCNEDGSVNVMNAAWGTMQERDTVVLNLTETHKTVQNIKVQGAFTVSIADAAHIFCRFFLHYHHPFK